MDLGDDRMPDDQQPEFDAGAYAHDAAERGWLTTAGLATTEPMVWTPPRPSWMREWFVTVLVSTLVVFAFFLGRAQDPQVIVVRDPFATTTTAPP